MPVPPRQMSTSTASVVILNWNAKPHLEPCLVSLTTQTYPNLHLLLVDNDSSDGSLIWIREHFPQVEILENEENRGFAAGNNAGILTLLSDKSKNTRVYSRPSASQAKDSGYIILANPDTIFDPDCIKILINTMEADETIGIAGCKTVYPDGHLQHVGGLISQPQALPSYIGHLEVDQGQYETIQNVDYVVGAAFAIRETVLAEIGLLDEGYFLYFEEVDFCTRAYRAGYRVVCVPAARLVHVESATTPKEDRTYLERFHSSRWRYLLKHLPAFTLLNDTMPAEQTWLSTRTLLEQAAASHAYWQTTRNLAEIMPARVRDGGELLTREQMMGIVTGLRRLTDSAKSSRTAQNYHIQEPTFHSSVPLIGGLIAWLRAAWINVAARWHIRPQLEQQNHFNEMAGEAILSLKQQLDAMEREQLELAWSLSDVELEINRHAPKKYNSTHTSATTQPPPATPIT